MLRHRASSKTGKLWTNEPHPMGPLAPARKLLNDLRVNLVLSFDKANEVRIGHLVALVTRIKQLIGQRAAGAIEAHDDRIEAAMKADMNGEALITIHVEPEEKAKLAGVPVL